MNEQMNEKLKNKIYDLSVASTMGGCIALIGMTFKTLFIHDQLLLVGKGMMIIGALMMAIGLIYVLKLYIDSL